MSKITATALVVLALLLGSAVVAVQFYGQRVLPVMDGVVTVGDLTHPADVRFDERGVPYVQAKTSVDAYTAQGFVTASERMFQMDVLRRTATGELADLFGPNSLAHDKLVKVIGFDRLAREELKQLPPDMKAELEAYSNGVNDYIYSASGRMPIQFVLMGKRPRQWQPQDSLAILKYLQYEEDESWQLDDLRQRVLDKVHDKLATFMFEQVLKANTVSSILAPPAAGFAPGGTCYDGAVSLLRAPGLLPKSLPIWGSNAWIVSGSMSDSKGCLLAYDSHAAFTAPDKYFLCVLSAPQMHVAGATIPGVPGIVSGRNDSIAWGSTVTHADTQDLVLEQLSPQFPGKYKTAGGWENTKERPEEITVRFGRPVTIKAVSTKHGPVLLENESTAVALNWTGLDTKEPVLKTILKINRANNWQEFTAAISTYSGPPHTFVYADKQGNIGYHVAGAIPIRASAGVTVVPGWTDAADWHGRVKFDDLPHGFNPSQGYAVADNPQFANVSSYNNPLRALRIGTILGGYKQSAQKVGLPEMANLQGDQAASFAALVKKELERAITQGQIIDEFEVKAMDSMRHWDGVLSRDSQAAAVYESFMRTFTRRILEPKVGARMTEEYLDRWPRWPLFFEKVMRTKPKEWLPPEERTYETFMITTFAQSLKNLKLATRSDDPNKCSWQALHQIRFQPLISAGGLVGNILDPVLYVGPLGVGGDQDSVNACNVQASVDPWNFICDSGPAHRLLIDMSDPDKFYESLVLGESEHFFSPYKKDQLTNWLRFEPHSIAFSASQVDKQQQHKVIFTNQ